MPDQFSYYFDGVRYTDTSQQFLAALTLGSENSQDIIDGIIESERRFHEEKSA